MSSIQVTVIERDGKPEYAVIPYDEFLRLQEIAEDMLDLQELREAKKNEGDAQTICFKDVKQLLDV